MDTMHKHSQSLRPDSIDGASTLSCHYCNTYAFANIISFTEFLHNIT